MSDEVLIAVYYLPLALLRMFLEYLPCDFGLASLS